MLDFLSEGGFQKRLAIFNRLNLNLENIKLLVNPYETLAIITGVKNFLSKLPKGNFKCHQVTDALERYFGEVICEVT